MTGVNQSEISGYSPNGKPIPVVSDVSVGRNDVAVKPLEVNQTKQSSVSRKLTSPTSNLSSTKNDVKSAKSKSNPSPEKEKPILNSRFIRVFISNNERIFSQTICNNNFTFDIWQATEGPRKRYGGEKLSKCKQRTGQEGLETLR